MAPEFYMKLQADSRATDMGEAEYSAEIMNASVGELCRDEDDDVNDADDDDDDADDADDDVVVRTSEMVEAVPVEMLMSALCHILVLSGTPTFSRASVQETLVITRSSEWIEKAKMQANTNSSSSSSSSRSSSSSNSSRILIVIRQSTVRASVKKIIPSTVITSYLQLVVQGQVNWHQQQQQKQKQKQHPVKSVFANVATISLDTNLSLNKRDVCVP
ncbi:hypothetical protein M0802_001132 [Mischocyttarus mexicanus]|nr:hypothetical protein M0802_001132 [Mischocyttarus mexicanus]